VKWLRIGGENVGLGVANVMYNEMKKMANLAISLIETHRPK
jgi:hypothetical protein